MINHKYSATRFLVLATIFAPAIYLIFCGINSGFGFPLDDAWIHQVFARNLSENGEWSFVLGTPSAGSTAPLWTLFLSLGYVLKVAPIIWAYFLGITMFSLSAFLAARLGRALIPEEPISFPLTLLFMAFEWHLVWAALSGMETSLFILSNLVFFTLLMERVPKWGWIGVTIGIAVWIRPDALTFMAPAVFVYFINNHNKIVQPGLLCFFIGLIIPLSLYGLFNYSLNGNFWPNTFFAKQAEYADLLKTNPLKRIISSLYTPFVGPVALLFPGILIQTWFSIRQKHWPNLGLLFWWIGFSILYAMRLPVTYQHGRYLMPVLPILIIFGIAGILRTKKHCPLKFESFILIRSWWISTLVVLLIFIFLGGYTFANDVAIIETEMVQTALWVEENTPEDAIVAVHDIGAIGYFTNRQIIDLAGLITPEVVPIIREEALLEAYLNKNNIDYLIIFPGWYPYLSSKGVEIYTTKSFHSLRAGGQNMTVYSWDKR